MAGVVSFFLLFLDLRERLDPDADEDREEVVDASFAVKMDAGCFRFLPRMGTGVRSIGS